MSGQGQMPGMSNQGYGSHMPPPPQHLNYPPPSYPPHFYNGPPMPPNMYQQRYPPAYPPGGQGMYMNPHQIYERGMSGQGMYIPPPLPSNHLNQF